MASTHNKAARQEKHATETVIMNLSAALADRGCNDDGNAELSDCLSVKELCSELGRSDPFVRSLIRECMSDGTCEFAGKRTSIGIDGRTTKTPVYRFKFKNRKKRK